jgi:hypothetical protein
VLLPWQRPSLEVRTNGTGVLAFYHSALSHIIISSVLLHSLASSVTQGKKLATLPFSTGHRLYKAYRSAMISCELGIAAKRK